MNFHDNAFYCRLYHNNAKFSILIDLNLTHFL